MIPESESNADLSQTIVNKVAEIAIASQLDSVSKIDVNIDSRASQLLQGKTNSLSIVGENIVTLKDIHLEKIDIACEDISLNLTQVLLGNIAFDRPGKFKIKFVFTESDCDRLLNSEYVRILLQNLDLEIEGELAHFYLQQSECHLEQQNGLSLKGIIVLQRRQRQTVPFELAFQFEKDGSQIGFRGGKYLENKVLDLSETVGIMNRVRDLLYLRHFENEDLACDITKIQIESEQLIIQADTEVKQLPNSVSQSIKSVSSEVNNQPLSENQNKS